MEARDASEAEQPVREINAGIYAFDVPSLLPLLAGLQPQNAQGEYYLTDLIGLLAPPGSSVHALKAADPQEALGVNTMAELAPSRSCCASGACWRCRGRRRLRGSGDDPRRASTCRSSPTR